MEVKNINTHELIRGRLEVRITHLRENEPCAIRIKNIWQRGLIIKMNTAMFMMKISLRDWGMIVCRPMGQVYFLEDRFRELPWQSIKCGLALGSRSKQSYEMARKNATAMQDSWRSPKGVDAIIHPLGEREAMVKLV
ncbi:uncharacterized protein [Polyergus mexicanus]|uniref:uncharacterized protein n=1 Tax=Polyergus mexicanus TaxID=615972 RepID=UPI0038B60E65